MSELKAHRFITTDELFPEANAGVLYYEKSEADKVIAELEEKLAAAQLVLRLNKPEALYSNLDTMNRLSHEIDVVARRERHQKYKRCLAMAKWCGYWADYWDCCEPRYCGIVIARARFFRKWNKRWLKIAEKFKPNN